MPETNCGGCDGNDSCGVHHTELKSMINKRKVVTKACNNCKRLHAKCSNERPCNRCHVNGLACVDSPRKKRVPRNKAFLDENWQLFCGFPPSAQTPNSGVSLVMTELADDSGLQSHPASRADLSKQNLEKCLGLSRPLPVYNPPPQEPTLMDAMNSIHVVPDYMKWNYAEMFMDHNNSNMKFFNPSVQQISDVFL